MIQGADAVSVERAINECNPFPGTRGFAGQLPNGRLVRDVLGRYPLFVERSGREWAFSPTKLDGPVSFPAGYVGDKEIWTLPDPPVFVDDTTAVSTVRAALRGSLNEIEDDSIAVAFSGGVDSAVVASELSTATIVVGFEGSHDIESAKKSARIMELSLEIVECTPKRSSRQFRSSRGPRDERTRWTLR